MDAKQEAKQPFSVWLRDRMDRRGLSGTSLARQLGLNPGTVFRWLNGQRQPEMSIHPALANAIGTSVEEIQEAMAGGKG